MLVGRVKLEDALQTYEDTGLHVLPCGPIPPNPSELLQSRAMDTLLDDLRAAVRHRASSTRRRCCRSRTPRCSPPSPTAPSSSPGTGSTTRDQLAHAVERLDAVDAKTLGVVLNLTRGKGGGDAYAYSYSYDYAPAEQPSGLAASEPRQGGPDVGEVDERRDREGQVQDQHAAAEQQLEHDRRGRG